MTEVAKVYYQDLAERRRNARGANNKKRGGGHKVNLPSENLSLAEVRAMNTPPQTYRMNEPVQFTVFQTWPEDLQRGYIAGLQERYRVNFTEIAHMMGATRPEFDAWRAGKYIPAARLGRAQPAPEWEEFKAKVKLWRIVETEIPVTMTALPDDDPPPAPKEPLVKLKPEYNKDPESGGDPPPLRAKEVLDMPDPALVTFLELLPALKAQGARIKIEVEL